MKNLSKYLGPYVDYFIKNDPYMPIGTEGRRFLVGDGMFLVWPDGERWRCVREYAKTFSSKEEAKNHLDNMLIASGNILLTEEQFEKLKVLI